MRHKGVPNPWRGVAMSYIILCAALAVPIYIWRRWAR